MTKALSDTQLTILSAACQREDRSVYPISTKLTGGALSKVLASLIGRGLLEQAPAALADEVWRTDDGGNRLTLRATPAAEAALGIGDAAAGSQEGGDTRKPKASAASAGKRDKARPARKGRSSNSKGKGKAAPTKRASARRTRANDGKPRAGTKQAKLIEMLQRKQGATVDEVVKALGWQPHTVRGAIAGALKKKLNLKIESEKVEGRGRVYRIAV
jgi:hypothetical protein